MRWKCKEEDEIVGVANIVGAKKKWCRGIAIEGGNSNGEGA